MCVKQNCLDAEFVLHNFDIEHGFDGFFVDLMHGFPMRMMLQGNGQTEFVKQFHGVGFDLDGEHFDAVFYRTYALLYHKFGNMIFFRSGNLYSRRSPGNQHYHKIIYFFIKKGRNWRAKFDNQKYISLIISRFINNYN